jgi:hypothetical protein
MCHFFLTCRHARDHDSSASARGVLSLLGVMTPEMFKMQDQMGFVPLDLCACTPQREEVLQILQVEDDMDDMTRAFTICKLVSSHDRAAAGQVESAEGAS